MSRDEIPLELEPLAGGAGALELARQRGRTSGSVAPLRRPLWALLLALALLGLVAWESAAPLVQRGAAATQGDWRAAAGRIKAERRSGEPVLFAPLWVEPLGRLHLGDQLTLEQQLLPDVDRHARVWEVSVRGARHRWLQALRPAKQWELGAVTVTLFEKPAQKVLFDFTAQILEARVDRQGPRAARCPLRQRRFVCDDRQAWNWVGPQLAEVDFRPQRCVYAHPVDGNVMRISYAAVPLGKQIVGYTGIDDYDNRKRGDKPVTVRIYVGPRLVGTIVHQNRWGWHRFDLGTADLAGQTHPVSFEVESGGAYARTFCLAAEARE